MKRFNRMTPKINVAILFMAIICLVGPHPSAAQESSSKKLTTESKKLKTAADNYNREVNKLNEMTPDIQVSLTYPAGKSPKVFTRGWVFGARCMVNPGTKEQFDISEDVRWKGTGTFTPDRGPLSRPVFNGPGTNQITLYFEENGKVVFEKTFTVEAVDPKGYARVGDIALCPSDNHGCIAEPHIVKGPITSGSPNVFIDGVPAARVGDTGKHALCCGPNTYVIQTGDPNVLIDGKPAARLGDQTKHCGGMGTIVSVYSKP